jgi:ABC-type uncharacterized transport system involved in gliding motility auxiliary subunit
MLIRFSGIAGAVIFLFGFIAALLVQNFANPMLAGHMVLGAILLLVWLFGHGVSSLGQAGEVLKGRTVRYGANAALYAVVFLGFVLVLNWFAYKHDKRWDLTENSVFSLSVQSSGVLASLKKPLKIVAFKGISQDDEVSLKELLDLYKSGSNLVETKLIDARTKPHLLETYEMKQGNVIYLEYGQGETKSVSRINEASEQGVTNAVIKLTRGESKKIYYVQGHEEPDLESDAAQGVKNFADSIKDEHLTVSGIILAEKNSIPEDAAAVILCSPKRPLLPEEKDMLIKYAEQGGRLLLFTDPGTTSDVKDIAAHFKIEIGNNVVLDQVQRLFAGPALGAEPIVRDYAPHAITKDLKSKDIVVFNIASSVKSVGTSAAGESWTDLMKTGSSAWAETDLTRLFDEENPSATFEQGVDTGGPVSLAVAYEKNLTATENKDQKDTEAKNPKFDKVARVVVFGDSDWIINANLLRVYSNRDVVLRALNWLAGEQGGVSIAKKFMRSSDAPMTQESFMLLLASSFLLPELILISGLFIWWRRRTVGA